MGIIKNNTDRKSLYEAGRIAGTICDELIALCQAGMSTTALEAHAGNRLAKQRSSAPFRQFEGFGHACCISLNAEIVNGPPSHERTIQEGDLVSIAIGSEYRGLHGKAARTTYLGNSPPPDIHRLIEGTSRIFDELMAQPTAFHTLNDILEKLSTVAAMYQLTIIQGTGGAGIGKKLHEPPIIPNNPQDLTEQIALVPGFAFVLMPMMTLGKDPGWYVGKDGWTHISNDNALTAHVAETILVTDNGLVLLTRPQAS